MHAIDTSHDTFKTLHSTASTQHDCLVRINRTIDHIGNHLEDDLSVDGLADVACFSKYHFHRTFRQVTGEPVTHFIQRTRLEKSIQMLIYNPSSTIGEISDRCGFSTLSNFSKAFKNYYSLSPRQVRKLFHFRDIKNFAEIISTQLAGHPFIKRIDPEVFKGYQTKNLIQALGDELFEWLLNCNPISLEVIPERFFAYKRYVGPLDPDKIFPTVSALCCWASDIRDGNPEVDIHKFSINLTRPEFTDIQLNLLDIGISLSEELPRKDGFGRRKLPGGLYATLMTSVTPYKQRHVWRFLVSHWLAEMPWELDDRQLMTGHPLDISLPPSAVVKQQFYLPVRSAN